MTPKPSAQTLACHGTDDTHSSTQASFSPIHELLASPPGPGTDLIADLSVAITTSCAFHKLSGGEAAVVLLALMGLSNAEIAEVRGATARTVANQLASVYRKLGGISRPGLARSLLGRTSDA